MHKNNLFSKIIYELLVTLIAVLIIAFIMLLVMKRNFAQVPGNGMSQAPQVGMENKVERALGVVFLDNNLANAGVSLSLR